MDIVLYIYIILVHVLFRVYEPSFEDAPEKAFEI